MVTAEQWINQQFSKQFINEDIYASKQGIKEAMIVFAKEAIKADRINLLEHVRVIYNSKNSSVKVDKDLIINAPNIELL